MSNEKLFNTKIIVRNCSNNRFESNNNRLGAVRKRRLMLKEGGSGIKDKLRQIFLRGGVGLSKKDVFI